MSNILDNLPKSWNDITVSQFQELFLVENDESEAFSSTQAQLSILLDIGDDDEFFDELDIDDLFKIISKIKWINSTPPLNFSKRLEKYTYKGLDKLTTGEFIDLEYFFGLNYIENLHIIAAILYKQTKIDEWDNVIEEPYVYDIYKRSEIFLEMPINAIYGLIDTYIKWKNEFLDIYSEIMNDGSTEIENEEALDEDELAEIKQEIEEETKTSKYGWESIVYSLANGDISKYDEIFNLPLILVMNTLAMKKSTGQ